MRKRLSAVLRAALVLALVAAAVVLLGGSVSAARPATGFGWPLAGQPRVDRLFDPPRTAYGPGHRGVDLRGWPGAEVRSAGPGWVSYAGLLAGRGVISVTHSGGLRTTYEPVEADVEVGQPVSRGSSLGVLTDGHRSCRLGTTCLHWGLLRGRTYLDPLSLIRSPELRLLPLGGAPAARVGSGPVLIREGPVAAPPAAASGGVRNHLGVTAAASGAALGLALLGGSAWRRQDARGRGP